MTDVLAEYLAQGLVAKAQESETAEAAKVGFLRGGTSGVIGLDGEVYGKCQRVAYLRQLGIQAPADASSQELFETGYASEAALLERLARGLPPTKRLATAAELDFEWVTANNTKVSGRPDGGVVDVATGKLDFGLEAKLAASLWTVLGVCYDLRPKGDHLIQAAHYSWRLGSIPFKLVYSVRSDYHLSTAPKWLTEKFKPGAPHVEFKDGKAFKVRPHTMIYDLTWDDQGRWCYTCDRQPVPQPTQITTAGLEAWYTQVAALGPDKSLPAKPRLGTVDGTKGYDQCKYCDWAPVCERTEDLAVGQWLDHIRAFKTEAAK